jgi:rRNA maturation RNase YbeY
MSSRATNRIEINIRVTPRFSSRVSRARLREATQKTLRTEKNNSVKGLSVVITDDESIRALNHRFHQTDTPTDVLSFASSQSDYWGDIIISYETARENARAARWHVQDELDLLVVHGILHLLGYDDQTPKQKKKMWERQREILGFALADE